MTLVPAFCAEVMNKDSVDDRHFAAVTRLEDHLAIRRQCNPAQNNPQEDFLPLFQ